MHQKIRTIQEILADTKYPACVGLSWLGSGWKKGSRHEVWNDLVSRPWPLHLRFLPTKWVTWDSNGARLNLFFRRNINER